MPALTFELTDIDSLAGLLPAFEFERLIAHGGMGAVYKARQRSLDRDVAIKILPRELGDDPHFRSSFQAEARAMARLNHPNLVKVFDSGDINGLLYIVMEYVAGKSLFDASHGMAIDPNQAAEIIIGVCRGLSHAHENGIVHRDIKPANILLTRQCEPKIGDFGLARCTRTNLDGLAMGTPDYMAPELISHPEKGDPRSDVHAIGVVLRELLTGVPAGSKDAAAAGVSDPALAAICRKATDPNPALRYPDALALADQLTRRKELKTTRKLVTPSRPVSQRPIPANLRPKPVKLAKQSGPGHGHLLKNCAVIGILLCAIHFTWGVYQKENEKIARQTRVQSEKARLTADKESPLSRNRDTNRQELAEEPSFQALVRLGEDGDPR